MKTAFIHGTHASAPLQVQPLKAEEEQALRYVAGYIPMKLKKKYAKQPDNVRALKYIECLHAMNEEEGDDVEFLQYTKLWVEQVNRGGLFQVNDDTYLFFQAMELASRHVLSVECLFSSCHQDSRRNERVHNARSICHNPLELLAEQG